MNKNGKDIKCKVCKKSFYISGSRIGFRKYCSKECAKKDDYGFKPKTKNCEWCGEQFKIENSLRTQDKYCESDCAKQAFHEKQQLYYKKLKDTKIEGVCAECKNVFIFTAKYKKTYCSKECTNKRMSKERLGESNPFYSNGSHVGAKKRRNSLHQYSCLKYKKDFLSKHQYPFCEVCSVNANGTPRFEVHHIYFASKFPRHPELHNFKNLIHICTSCHGKFHAGKTYQEVFEKLEEIRGLKKLFATI